MKLKRGIILLLVAIASVVFLTSKNHVLSQGGDDSEFVFQLKHRVNAHGDEFNALAKSSDGKRLFIGTEKGELIVWNILANRLERTLHQPTPIHFLASLSHPSEVVISGSKHVEPHNALVRQWNVDTGVFVDLKGVDTNSFPTALATEVSTGLIGVATRDGTVRVWDLNSPSHVAEWKLDGLPMDLALLHRAAYVPVVDREAFLSDEPRDSVIQKLSVDNPKQPAEEFSRLSAKSWTNISVSPGGRFLTAAFSGPGQSQTVIIDPVSKKEVGSLEGSESTWISPFKLLMFEAFDPSTVGDVPVRGRKIRIRKLKRMKADTEGRAFDLSDQVASEDGSKAWATYRKGPGFLEFDLRTNKIKTLIRGQSGAYSISVSQHGRNEGRLLTSGADGFVRLWNLDNISLIREFRVAPTDHFVSAAHLLSDARKAVVEIMRVPKRMAPPGMIEVILLDLQTGRRTKLMELGWSFARPRVVNDHVLYWYGDQMRLRNVETGRDIREFKVDTTIVQSAVSSNGQTLATRDENNKLAIFDLATGEKKEISIQAGGESGPLVVTNDGRYAYQIVGNGELKRWDFTTGEVNQTALGRIQEMHTRVDFMTLANEDKWLVVAGNHGDVGIFDRTTLRLLCYTQTSASAFFVERVWVLGDRMIFTTDTGVMFDGKLIPK